MRSSSGENIAIIGGGITGLFCAYILARNGKSVRLFEASERLGGRIRTIRLNNTNEDAGKQWDPCKLEFCAEFGPMRLELDKQLLVKALLNHLEIKPLEPGKEAKPHWIDFPSYASPTMASDPKYELRRDEEGKTPLQLLRMAVLRVIAHLEISHKCHVYKKLEKLKDDIKLAAATQEVVEPIFVGWVKKLKPRHLWEIQTEGRIGWEFPTDAGIEKRDTPLYTLGFWNLLSDYLSHDAIMKLRDLGTFYHLLPENPNAAEWLVWWLIGFGASDHLHGIFGGMQCIVDELVKKLESVGVRPVTKCKATGITEKNGKFDLAFEQKPNEEDKSNEEAYERVILALPKSPLEKIVHASLSAFKSEKDILSLLDSAFSFPMVKLFVVVKERWWEETNRANRYATKVPTRELHYWKGPKDSKQGLVMLYTDRPASSFWANYLPPEKQPDANWGRNPPPQNASTDQPLPAELRERLIRKAVQYINENNLPDITEKDIVWYGIRDWGREPFGGANHAWRPERRYWVVMGRLGDIADGSATPSIHVCGEAYSDYHGFIEGSLRSAVYVLHRILDSTSELNSLSWLKSSNIDVETAYLKALQHWVRELDDPKNKGSYL
jgi:hypothetical protein